ncbi:NACHT domain-containing protein [Actinoplanes subglobosus]|uniref:NACHT domain-containing protein n=1 Tax=Actinoplanes subglobosus TaxID=1547892 RepID=A0ABV8J855_9ACTN
MPKAFSYAQAVQILGGGPGTEWVKRLNDLTCGVMLGAAATTSAVLAWFDAHTAFARVSEQLVRTVSLRLAGSHRLERTERIAASHSVIVIAAYFDALGSAHLPFDLAQAAITAEDQLRLADARETDSRSLAESALTVGVHLPEPHGLRADHLAELAKTYRGLSESVGRFLRGLAFWDVLSPGEERRVEEELGRLPETAVLRYEQMLLDLRAECPEVDLWIRDWDTLREIYQPARFRVLEAVSGIPASAERSWTPLPIHADLQSYLLGFLTSPRAQSAPLMVLGQPGAGKSVLTKMLAADLATCGFVPVRVSLRDVDSGVSLQRQIEQAIQDATGESLPWPRLAEAAAGRLPVILLDGYDELLQATGSNQNGYLRRVADFQQRERDLGRGVAVVLTTRSSVADRTAAPAGTLMARLEPFDDGQVTAWLDVWRAANEKRLAARGSRALPAEDALRFRDLAGQPLLLLLLALYDADGNALQRTTELSLGELYEKLLTSFVRREVGKAGPGAWTLPPCSSAGSSSSIAPARHGVTRSCTPTSSCTRTSSCTPRSVSSSSRDTRGTCSARWWPDSIFPPSPPGVPMTACCPACCPSPPWRSGSRSSVSSPSAWRNCPTTNGWCGAGPCPPCIGGVST